MNSSPQVYAHIARLDLLRALAVSIVVVFHLLPQVLPWGYVGVDMFFSLSGFLMTLLYLQARANGHDFSAQRFVTRRFWRIFPPLVITITLTLLAAFAVMSPEHLLASGWSGIAALFSVSNVLFFTEAGYFDTDALFKPLLHTWSLAVEEQFYIIFALALLMTRFVPLFVVLSTLSAISLGAWLWVVLANTNFGLPTLHDQPFSALFFLPQYRAFQFTFGGLVAYLMIRNVAVPRWIETLGALLLGIACWLAADKEFAHVSALFVVLGMSCLMLHAPLLDRGAQIRVVRYLARISYQIYLVHWPVIVIWHYITLSALSYTEAAFCALLCLVLADLLYRLSNPLRAS